MDKRFLPCFKEWSKTQCSDLDEILRATSDGDGHSIQIGDEELQKLVAKSMTHYEDYCVRRRAVVAQDAPTFFVPPWCNSFEKSFLWLGGCRPSMFIRLVYSVTSSGLENFLDEDSSVLPVFDCDDDVAPSGQNLLNLTASQLALVDKLHRQKLKAEDALTSRLATLHEEVADRPMYKIVEEMLKRSRGRCPRKERTSSAGDKEMGAAFDVYEKSMAEIIEEADKLRLETARELLVGILTPKQAVALLAAAKELHLFIHEWGQQRDESKRCAP